MPTRRCLPHGSPLMCVCRRSYPYGGIGLEKQRSIKKDYAVLYKALSMTSRAHTNEVILICRLRRQMHPSKHLHLPQQGNLRVF